MRALTLTQPWAGLVASGIKRIENRPRPIIRRQDFGAPFAIHASREIDDDVYDRIFDIAPELGGGIRAAHNETWWKLTRITSAVIAIATIDKAFTGWDAESITEHAAALSDSAGTPIGPSQVRWFFGPIGYVLRDVRVLETPVPCRGNQGFWTLPADAERAVREALL